MSRRTSVTAPPDPLKFAAAKGQKASLFDEQATYEAINWLLRLPDPDEILRKTGKNRSALRALEYDDEISQCLDTRREAIIGTPWRLEPQQSTQSKFITEQLVPWIEDLIRGVFSAVGYGYSVIEVVYSKPTGGNPIGLSLLSEKPFEWFLPKTDGSLRFFPVNGSGGSEGLECDPRKYILSRRNPTYRNPYGEALLSRLYWPFCFKTQGRRFWSQFLERFGFPIIVGEVSDPEGFVKAMQSLGIFSPIGVPMGSKVEAVTQTAAGEFERFDNTFARSVQKAILGQTLTSEVGDKGSFAAAKVHDSVRMDKRNADIRMVTRAAQAIVNALAGLNGWDAPLFVLADDTGLEIERATRDANLVDKGVLKLTKQYLLDRYDFQPGDFEIPEDDPAQDANDNGGGPDLPDEANAAAHTFAAKPRFTPKQQAIEDRVAEALAGLGSPISDAEIKAAVLAANTVEEVRDNLIRLLPDTASSEFRRAMERAMFAAGIMGYAHAQ